MTPQMIKTRQLDEARNNPAKYLILLDVTFYARIVVPLRGSTHTFALDLTGFLRSVVLVLPLKIGLES